MPVIPANSVAFGNLAVPPGAPAWLAATWNTMLSAPLPALSAPSAVPSTLPALYTAADPTGQIATYQPGGPTYTPTNAFFLPLGTNGRTCATCHVPSDAMGLSLTTINQRYMSSFGRDPLFAPVDGATCPKNVPSTSTRGSLIGGFLGVPGSTPTAPAYTTILEKGLFRIPLPVPANAQFTVSVVSDPYGCNTDPHYSRVVDPNGATHQIVSVYRRPSMAANLKFKVNTAANTGLLPPVDLIDGSPLPTYTAVTTAFGTSGNGNIETGDLENGNIMSDGREPTLSSQAIDATLGHAQALVAPSAAQVAQILQFEDGIYAAQYTDNLAGLLFQSPVTGGPQDLAADAVGTLGATQVMSLYNAWNGAMWPQQASIYRGQQIFNTRKITVSNVAGFNNAVGTNAFKGTCSTCHGQTNVGADPTPLAQHDVGVGGGLVKFGGPAPAADLPVFKVTCSPGTSTPFNGSVVLTNDPGRALITGKCADIGRFTVGVLRGLAARAPYFSDGSAATLWQVINFYNTRFNIGLSMQDQEDLVNFLNSL